MALQALLNNGDEVLIPAPDYPLWTAVGQPLRRHAPCTTCATRPTAGCPTSPTSAARSPTRTKAIVDHQPEQPDRRASTRARLLEGSSSSPAGTACWSSSDEIYDKILYDDAEHISVAALAPDLLVPDLQRAVEGLPGRPGSAPAGWCCPARRSTRRSYIEGLDILANMRLCPNVPGPVRGPDRARRLPEHQRPGAARRPPASSSATGLASCSTTSPA